MREAIQRNLPDGVDTSEGWVDVARRAFSERQAVNPLKTVDHPHTRPLDLASMRLNLHIVSHAWLRFVHRFNYHHMTPCATGEVVAFCHWCGLRADGRGPS
jgi:hypothetical protein